MMATADSQAELKTVLPGVSGDNEQVWIDVIQQMDAIYTELVQYQVELEEKNRHLEKAQSFIQSVLSSMSDILIVCDEKSHIIQVNAALEDATGMATDELLGRPLSALLEDSRQLSLIQTAEAVEDMEVRLKTRQGEFIPILINCSALAARSHRQTGFVMTGRPVGELRKAYLELQQTYDSLKETQQQLLQSEKMASLGRLVAGVAHELNNPISFLYANMHVLRQYEKKLSEYLNTLHHEHQSANCERLRKDLRIDKLLNDLSPLVEGSLEGAERVSEIVKNLRQFATPQKQPKKQFDLIHVLNRALAWVLNAATIKPDIVTEYPQQLMVFNHEGYVHQILINLIQNAVDSMKESATPSPRLDIRIHNKEQRIRLQVHDNGRGIAEEDLSRIFDPFFTTKEVGYGTGLGLYISYGLAVEHCKGDLSVCNHPQGGAVFTLTLPQEIADE